jgi:two-component system, chemotaxis family, protein-glutamate methylesterase/glutaminase
LRPFGLFGYGDLTPFTCPECHGALVKIREGGLVRYRCHTGHGVTANALLAGVTDTVEDALWNAVRALEESVMLLDDIAHNLAELGRVDEAKRFKDKAEQARVKAKALQAQAATTEHLSQDNLQTESES